MHGNNCAGPLILIILVAIFAIPIGVAYAIVRPSPRSPTPRTPPTPLSLLVAQDVATRLLLFHRAAATVGFVCTAATLVSGMAGTSVFLAIGSVLVLRHVSDCRNTLRRLERAGASAERHDTWLVVRDHSGESSVRANDRVFRAAARTELPTASIERG